MREPDMFEILTSIRLMTKSGVNMDEAFDPKNKTKIEQEIARLMDQTSLDYNPAVASFLRNEYQRRRIPKEVVQKHYEAKDRQRAYEAKQFDDQLKLRGKFRMWAVILGLCGLPFGLLPGFIIFAALMYCAPDPEGDLLRRSSEENDRCCHR